MANIGVPPWHARRAHAPVVIDPDGKVIIIAEGGKAAAAKLDVFGHVDSFVGWFAYCGKKAKCFLVAGVRAQPVPPERKRGASVARRP